MILLPKKTRTNTHLSTKQWASYLKAKRVKDLELHNAVSSDDDHPHFLVRGGRVCCVIQHEVHERVVASQDTLPKKRRDRGRERDTRRERESERERESKRTRWTISTLRSCAQVILLILGAEETHWNGKPEFLGYMAEILRGACGGFVSMWVCKRGGVTCDGAKVPTNLKINFLYSQDATDNMHYNWANARASAHTVRFFSGILWHDCRKFPRQEDAAKIREPPNTLCSGCKPTLQTHQLLDAQKPNFGEHCFDRMEVISNRLR